VTNFAPINLDGAIAGEIILRRTVRAGILRAEAGPAQAPTGNSNGFAGIPLADGFGAHHELTIALAGRPDGRTGYLVGIQHVDALVRAHGWPLLESMWRERPTPSPSAAVRRLADALAAHAPPGSRLRSVEWAPSPFVQHTWSSSMPDHAIVTEHFEFSAAHRLHCPDLGDEENRRIFGKCNHASGHGHNYRVAVSARVPVGPGSPTLGVGQLASIVNRCVIDRFDHRHLNVDCPEFAALNPSVEHIAMVCHGLLEEDIAATGAALDRVTVWETEKTSASYPARD
jgi:6-pyruvoyltetrahydropterin/6-carboxytetrahydropterin synthase